MEPRARAFLEAIAARLRRDPEQVKAAIERTTKTSWAALVRKLSVAMDLKVVIMAMYLYIRSGNMREAIYDKQLLLALAGLIYVLTPFDAIPDYIPLAGYADDAFVVTQVAASLGLALAPHIETVMSRSRAAASSGPSASADTLPGDLPGPAVDLEIDFDDLESPSTVEDFTSANTEVFYDCVEAY